VTTRVRVCPAADLAPGSCRRLDTTPPVTVFNAVGEFFAVDDTCTHAEASLAEGYIDDDCVECPAHSAVFSLRTGQPLGPPASRPLRIHAVVIEDGEIYVELADDPSGA
jgi:3-phenylpropionate/trans-cinnamate dioxygenase ferredoxin subunit